MLGLTKHLLQVRILIKRLWKLIPFEISFLIAKSKSDTDRKAYNAQRNLGVSLIRQAKKHFLSNPNTQDATDNKAF